MRDIQLGIHNSEKTQMIRQELTLLFELSRANTSCKLASALDICMISMCESQGY